MANGQTMSLKPISTSAPKASWVKAPPPPKNPTPPVVRWKLSRVLDAPHRLGFFSAACVLAFSALWWLAVLGFRAMDIATPWAVNPSLAHALFFTWGFMPLFVVGFLFTAGPRWLQVTELAAPQLLPAVLGYTAALFMAVAGFHASASLAAFGLSGMALAWGRLGYFYLQLWQQSRASDKAHGTVILVAAAAGLAGLLLCAIGAAVGHDTLVRTGIHVGLWFFIATVFAAVSHRMIPFFTASAIPFLDSWRPMWLLWCMVGVLWWGGIGSIADLWLASPAPTWRWIQVAVEGNAAALMLWLAVRWGLVQSLKIRLLAMLHTGFLWLGIALAMAALHHAWLATHDEVSAFGLAPLHALTMGYLGSTLFAMATRVAAGHSGRPLAADNIAWGVYWVVQCAIVLRVTSVFFPDGGTGILVTAISLWAIACGAWAMRYGHWMGLPRLDGKPG